MELSLDKLKKSKNQVLMALGKAKWQVSPNPPGDDRKVMFEEFRNNKLIFIGNTQVVANKNVVDFFEVSPHRGNVIRNRVKYLNEKGTIQFFANTNNFLLIQLLDEVVGIEGLVAFNAIANYSEYIQNSMLAMVQSAFGQQNHEVNGDTVVNCYFKHGALQIRVILENITLSNKQDNSVIKIPGRVEGKFFYDADNNHYKMRKINVTNALLKRICLSESNKFLLTQNALAKAVEEDKPTSPKLNVLGIEFQIFKERGLTIAQLDAMIRENKIKFRENKKQRNNNIDESIQEENKALYLEELDRLKNALNENSVNLPPTVHKQAEDLVSKLTELGEFDVTDMVFMKNLVAQIKDHLFNEIANEKMQEQKGKVIANKEKLIKLILKDVMQLLEKYEPEFSEEGKVKVNEFAEAVDKYKKKSDKADLQMVVKHVKQFHKEELSAEKVNALLTKSVEKLQVDTQEVLKALTRTLSNADIHFPENSANECFFLGANISKNLSSKTLNAESLKAILSQSSSLLTTIVAGKDDNPKLKKAKLELLAVMAALQNELVEIQKDGKDIFSNALNDKLNTVLNNIGVPFESQEIDVDLLAEIVTQTNNLLNGEATIVDIKCYLALANKLIHSASWGRVLAGSILIIAGLALVSLSVAVAFSVFGVIAPVSIAGITLTSTALTNAISGASGALGICGIFAGAKVMSKAKITHKDIDLESVDDKNSRIGTRLQYLASYSKNLEAQIKFYSDRLDELVNKPELLKFDIDQLLERVSVFGQKQEALQNLSKDYTQQVGELESAIARQDIELSTQDVKYDFWQERIIFLDEEVTRYIKDINDNVLRSSMLSSTLSV